MRASQGSETVVTSQENKLIHVMSEVFAGHQVACTVEDKWITFKKAPDLRLRAEFSQDSDARAQLDVFLELGDGRTIVESFVGFETSFQSAKSNAVEYFCTADFHVLLNTFFGSCDHDNQVMKEEWRFASGKRKVVCGNVIPRQIGTNHLTYEWFNTFESAIKSAHLDNRLHWVRLFFAQQENQPITHELLLDNDAWEPFQSAVLNWKWARHANFYSMRMFLTILPEQT